MSENPSGSPARTSAEATGQATRERAAYEPPAVLFVERLEALADTCVPPAKRDTGACPAGPISS